MRNWEQCYQNGEMPWDRGVEAPPLGELLDRLGVGCFGGGPVLVPGCGRGHDVRALAGSGLEVVGLDISPTAVDMARAIAAVGGERYEVGDFLDAGWTGGRVFSALWEHTCFCALDPGLRGAYARSAAAVLPAGAVMAGVYYLEPSNGPDGGGPPFEVTVEELEACFARWFVREYGWVPERAYPGREGREWVGVFRRNAVPVEAGG